MQLGPRLFTSIAASQDAAMDMIAHNLFGRNLIRWSELRECKNDMRCIFGSSGYCMEEVHHFGAELFMPSRLYRNPPVLLNFANNINPRDVSILLSPSHRVSLHRVIE